MEEMKAQLKFQRGFSRQTFLDIVQIQKNMNDESTWKGHFAKSIRSLNFDTTMTNIIFANASTIGVEVQFHATGADSYLTFDWVGRLFFFIYVVELMLQLWADGLSFLKRTNQNAHWKWFDFSLVIIMVADELLKHTGWFVDANMINLLRFSRFFRLVRMVHLILSLEHLVYLIAASIRPFVWTALLIVIFMYGFAP